MSMPMRLLFLSNYYPPFSLGGYELWCQEVGDALRARGCRVAVLTARAPGQEPAVDPGEDIHRALSLEVEGGLPHTIGRILWTREKREQENLAYLRRLVDAFKPQAAVVWGMWNVPRSVPALLEQLMPGRVMYYFCDYWPSLPSAYVQRWQESARHAAFNAAKAWMGRWFMPMLQKPLPDLAFERPVCVSKAVRRELVRLGTPVEHADVLYGGISVERFLAHPRDLRGTDEALRLVFLGRLVADKGLHTVIDAIGQLPDSLRTSIVLDIFGSGEQHYVGQLQARVHELGLAGNVRFLGRVDHAEVPEILPRYHGLVFPSIWQEPFARTVLEGMAAGLAVIGSLAGGTGEILIDGETGLTFPPGDAAALAEQLQRLYWDDKLRRTVAAQGQARVREDFTLGKMVDGFASHLASMQNQASHRDRENFPSAPVTGEVVA